MFVSREVEKSRDLSSTPHIGLSLSEANAIARLDGHAQAALVRSGEVPPGALIEAAIMRIEAVDPGINCVSARTYDHARAAEFAADAPMAGVPYLLKASMEYRGFPLQSGSRARLKSRATRSFPFTDRLDEAGLVPVGMSSMSEFGLNATAETMLHGVTRNPWDLSKSAGGSSTGAGAAVAARIVPFATATDGGGSIRVPASNSGIIGFKPSRGWNVRARGPHILEDILCSDALCARSMRDATWAARWLRPVAKKAGARLKRPLKIAFNVIGWNEVQADPDVVDVIHRAAKLCEDLGHDVVEGRPPINGSRLRQAFTDLWAYLGGEAVDLSGAEAELLEPFTQGLAEVRASIDPERIACAFAEVEAVTRSLVDYHQHVDVVLSPVTSSAPPPLGWLAPTRDFNELWQALFDYVAFTPVHNMSGSPSISLPLFPNGEGMPIGAMFSAMQGKDEYLLSLGEELEQAHPWTDRVPRAAHLEAEV